MNMRQLKASKRKVTEIAERKRKEENAALAEKTTTNEIKQFLAESDDLEIQNSDGDNNLDDKVMLEDVSEPGTFIRNRKDYDEIPNIVLANIT